MMGSSEVETVTEAVGGCRAPRLVELKMIIVIIDMIAISIIISSSSSSSIIIIKSIT